MSKREWAHTVQAIVERDDLSPLEKLTAAFDRVTESFIEYSRRQAELHQAMGDEQAVIKERIKVSVMQEARDIYETCALLATGARRSVWNDPDER